MLQVRVVCGSMEKRMGGFLMCVVVSLPCVQVTHSIEMKGSMFYICITCFLFVKESS